MCNAERLRTTPDELRRWFDVQLTFDFTGNLQGGDVFPRQSRPVIRQRPSGQREAVIMEWGFPYIRKELKKDGTPYAPKPTTNVRHPHYPMWREWAKDPAHRCLVPSTAFAEPNPRAKEPGQPRNIWFGMKEPAEGLYAFAGLWRGWDGDWNKHRAVSESSVYAILTCDPNALVAPVHPKAMPVILRPEDYEAWLTAPWDTAKSLQAPLSPELMAIYPSEEEEKIGSLL